MRRHWLDWAGSIPGGLALVDVQRPKKGRWCSGLWAHPIVSLWCEISRLGFTAAVLTFFIVSFRVNQHFDTVFLTCARRDFQTGEAIA